MNLIKCPTCGTLPFVVAVGAGLQQDQSRQRRQLPAELVGLAVQLLEGRAPSQTSAGAGEHHALPAVERRQQHQEDLQQLAGASGWRGSREGGGCLVGQGPVGGEVLQVGKESGYLAWKKL